MRQQGRGDPGPLAIAALDLGAPGGRDDRVRAPLQVGVVPHLLEQFAGVARRIGKPGGDVGKAGAAVFGMRQVQLVQDAAGQELEGCLLPVVRGVEAATLNVDQHQGDVLGVRHLVGGEEPHFRERIPAGAAVERTRLPFDDAVAGVLHAPPG